MEVGQGSDPSSTATTSKMLRKLDIGNLRLEDAAQPESPPETKTASKKGSTGLRPGIQPLRPNGAREAHAAEEIAFALRRPQGAFDFIDHRGSRGVGVDYFERLAGIDRFEPRPLTPLERRDSLRRHHCLAAPG